MDFKVIQMLIALISGMTTAELASFLFILSSLLILAVKSTIKVVEYINKNKQKDDDANINPKNAKNRYEQEQMLIQLTVIKDKVSDIELTCDKINGTLMIEIASLVKKIENLHNEQHESHRDIVKNMDSIEQDITILKDKIVQVEMQLPNNSNKDLLKDLNISVQGISKDVATLQGTILGNLSSRNSR